MSFAEGLVSGALCVSMGMAIAVHILDEKKSRKDTNGSLKKIAKTLREPIKVKFVNEKKNEVYTKPKMNGSHKSQPETIRAIAEQMRNF